MRSLTSYLLAIFMVMFWIFRIVVAFTASIGINIGFNPINLNMEIVLLFVTIPCIVLVFKRNIIGSILYLIVYLSYFGIDLYGIVTGIMSGYTTLVDYTRALSSFIGVVLPIVVFFNLLIDKNRITYTEDKKTDWFYKNEEYDRKLDSRVDKNQYRNY